MLISFVLRKPALTTLFQLQQFSWPGYHKPYRLDISDRRGGLLLYVKSHLLSRR